MRILGFIGRTASIVFVLLPMHTTLGWCVQDTAGTTFDPPAIPVERILTLEDAIRRTREGNHGLRAAGLASSAARARVRDAGRIQNPSIGAAVENFGGSLGTARTESSLFLEQPLELGGDRSSRVGLAEAQAALTLAQQEQLVRAVEGETVERFCDAWVLQQRVERLREAEAVAQRAVEVVEERSKAGGAPAFEVSRSASFRSLREIERKNAEVELGVVRRRLALQWGDEAAAFDSLFLPDPSPPVLPPLDSLISRLESHPERRRAMAENAAQSWRIREARAARVPDVQLMAGVRHLAEVEGTGLVAGLSLPLPVWNPMSGAISAAEAEYAASTARERQIALEVRGELTSAYERLAAAISVWTGIRDRVQPATVEAMRLILGGYRSGRLGFLDVQDGQRNLQEAEVLLIEASARVWRSQMALERLIGSSLDVLSPEGEER